MSNVKCAEGTKAYLWKFVEDIKTCNNLDGVIFKAVYHSDHQIPAHKSNELSFYEKQLQILKDIEKEQRSH